MPDNVPEIHDKTPKLVSFMQERRAWAVIGIVVIVMLIILVSGGTQKTAKKISTAAVSQDKPMAPEDGKRYVQELQRATNELAEQKTRTEAIKADAEKLVASQAAQPTAAATQGTVSYQAASAPAPAAKHESFSVLSFRNGAQQPPAAVTATSPAADIRALIDQEKDALAQNIATSQAIRERGLVAQTQSPPPATVQPTGEAPAQAPAVNLNASVGKGYRLFEGTLIETVLTNRLNGSFTGPVEVMVTSPVYSHDREHILIPQGSKVIGEAQRVGTQGQQRLAVVFHRIIMPDGYSESMDKFTGLNQLGETGLKDKVDNHIMQIFGTSIALGLIQGFSQFGTGSALTSNGVDQYRQGVASSIGQSSSQVLSSKLNILPTITIREGNRVRIFIRQDIDLPAYTNHRIPGDI